MIKESTEVGDAAAPTEIHVVLNCGEELKQRVPAMQP